MTRGPGFHMGRGKRDCGVTWVGWAPLKRLVEARRLKRVGADEREQIRARRAHPIGVLVGYS